MGTHSGKFGAANGISTLRNWVINELSQPKQFAASNTRGAHGRRAGIKDWNGSYGAYGGSPLILPGETFSFEGYTAPDDDVEGSTGAVYSGDAVIESVAITWDWRGSNIISHTANFSGAGPLTETTDIITDISDPDAPPITGARIEFDGIGSEGSGSGSGSELCVATATLTLSAPSQTFVNSCTGGYTGRRSGNLDWTLSIVMDENRRSEIPFDIGDDIALRLFIDADRFWRLKWGHVRDFSGLTVDRETGTIISQTCNIDMNGFLGGAIGEIISPDAVQWWPAVP
jgi:hypothetical protein